MITGSVYSYEFQDILNGSIQKAKEKYGLILMETPSKYSFNYSNSKCNLSIFVSDIQSFKWNFHDPIPKESFLYEPSNYIEFVLHKERPRMTFDKPLENLEGKIKGIFDNFNREIIDYMEAPMSGDFSWHDVYLEKYMLKLKYAEFSFSTNASHSKERRIVAKMHRRKETGWENAIEFYFKKHYSDGGEEFEVDPIFKS